MSRRKAVRYIRAALLPRGTPIRREVDLGGLSERAPLGSPALEDEKSTPSKTVGQEENAADPMVSGRGAVLQPAHSTKRAVLASALTRNRLCQESRRRATNRQEKGAPGRNRTPVCRSRNPVPHPLGYGRLAPTGRPRACARSQPAARKETAPAEWQDHSSLSRRIWRGTGSNRRISGLWARRLTSWLPRYHS